MTDHEHHHDHHHDHDEEGDPDWRPPFMDSERYFKAVIEAIQEVRELEGVLQYEITKGDVLEKWAIDFTNMTITKGGVDNPTATLKMSDDNFVKLLLGQEIGVELLISGDVKMSGNMTFAMASQTALDTITNMSPFEIFRAKL